MLGRSYGQGLHTRAHGTEARVLGLVRASRETKQTGAADRGAGGSGGWARLRGFGRRFGDASEDAELLGGRAAHAHVGDLGAPRLGYI